MKIYFQRIKRRFVKNKKSVEMIAVDSEVGEVILLVSVVIKILILLPTKMDKIKNFNIF
jgi:hypothetical protein